MKSRPAWGAWIEIGGRDALQGLQVQSRPAWGAWIEMATANAP